MMNEINKGECIMKKILSVLLAFCMVIALTPLSARADNSGSCGKNAYWTLDDEGTLTISGTGATDSCYSFVYNQAVNVAPWIDYMDDIRRVVIEEGITELGEWSFMPAHNLESVQLPESLTIIGGDAFGAHQPVHPLPNHDGLGRQGRL